MREEIATAERQRTIRQPVSASGIALHTGNRVKITLRPAPPETGVRFRRLDLPGTPEIRAHAGQVSDTRRGTTISEGGAAVHTVEHLLAAANALGYDNLIVEMAGPEPPVFDGSAQQFVELLDAAGAAEQEAPRRYFVIDQPVWFSAGETHVVALPDSAFRISCSVKYNATILDCQYLSLEITAESFRNQLQLARTFCLFHEIEYLIKNNLIRGGSLDNAVVIKGDAVLSKDGLRYPDEFVRHKMLDMVGDLFLAGRRLKGHFIGIKPGHPANVELARRIIGLPPVKG
ncbi:MAG: UDP-3-O-acyl-N-acetylglucosamine deacetylase [Lentisphaeria bacterium]|jgi:UDP-3-O-[3-hydroxymyristoyl] N-acetylglucosamine deacetylase/3-hydroxyacyl-[acyl-carrier-protein] dehydratase